MRLRIAKTDKESALAYKLRYYGEDVLQFIAVSAKIGALTAAANLLALIILRVDFPVLWCVLFFFLHFIPSIGFLIALVPPAIVALLTFGWQRALLVIAGMIITEMLSDYLLTPMLMKRCLDVSILETALSMLIWAFLLGPAGAIVAIPLMMALKRSLNDSFTEHRTVPELELDEVVDHCLT